MRFIGLASALLLTTGTAWTQERPPNVVILFADDLGYGDLGCYGHPLIRTPNLDRMAAEGVRLTSFYAAPSCSPARGMLMTGRYPFRTGIHRVYGPESEDGIPSSEITLAEAMKTKGYRTAIFGKWHLGSAKPEHRPLANGFDRYFGLLYSNDMIKPWVQTDKPLRLWRNDAPTDEYPVVQKTLTDRYTNEAVRFIREAKSAPFFLYLPYAMPHLPISVSDELQGRSKAGLYGDVIEAVDWSAGRILDALAEEGLDNNTLVIFSSDNGPWLNLPDRMLAGGVEHWHAGSPGPFRGAKGTTYEGGVRVPFLARWPGRIPPGRVLDGMASVLDVYATVTALADVRLPGEYTVDGMNVMAFLIGDQPSPRREHIYMRAGRLQALRIGDWKYRLVPSDGGETASPELYNLRLDPSERYNVVDRYADEAEKLAKRFEEIRDARLQ